MKKKQKRLVALLCRQLPESYTIRKHSSFKKGMDLDQDIVEKSGMNPKDIDLEGYYKHSRPVLEPVNHEQRIKRAFSKYGEKGIKDYITWLQINNTEVNKKLSDLEKMKPIDQKILDLVKGSAGSFWKNLIFTNTEDETISI